MGRNKSHRQKSNQQAKTEAKDDAETTKDNCVKTLQIETKIPDCDVTELVWAGKFLQNSSHLEELRHPFLDRVVKLEDDGICLEEKMKSCKSHMERIKTIKEFGFSWIPVPEHLFQKLGKSAEISTHFRERANLEYKHLNFTRAIRGYNLAICFGRPGKEETGLSYANRSAIFLHIKEPNLALRDISLAEQNNFPHQLKGKLLERRKKCEDMIKQQQEKEEEVEECNRKRKDCTHEEHDSNIIYSDGVKKAKYLREYCQREFFTLTKPSTSLVGAEDFVDMGMSAQRGRRIFVNKDIPAGTTIMLEKPYVMMLEKELTFDTEHCQYCLKRILAGIPCEFCTFAMYCDEECREKAQIFHQYEHKTWVYLHQIEYSRSELLAIRIIEKLGPQKIYSLYKEWCSKKRDKCGSGNGDDNISGCEQNVIEIESVIPGFNTDGIYDPSDYTTIYNLVAHTKTEELCDVVSSTFKALVLAHLLHSSTPFFHFGSLQQTDSDLHLDLTKDDFTNREAQNQDSVDLIDFTASLILLHLESIPYNAISLSEFRTAASAPIIKTPTLKNLLMTETSLCTSSTSIPPPSPSPSQQEHNSIKSVSYASAIFGLLSMCNHSCNPNVIIVSDKSNEQTAAVVSLKDVSAGTEIEITYGPLFSIQNQVESRRKTLYDKYKFHCECSACVNEFQVHTNYDRSKIDSSIKLKDLDKYESVLHNVYELVEKECYQDAIEKVKPCLRYFGSNFPSFFPLTIVAQDLFKKSVVHVVNT